MTREESAAPATSEAWSEAAGDAHEAHPWTTDAS